MLEGHEYSIPAKSSSVVDLNEHPPALLLDGANSPVLQLLGAVAAPPAHSLPIWQGTQYRFTES